MHVAIIMSLAFLTHSAFRRHAFAADSLLSLVYQIVRGNFPPIPKDVYSPGLSDLVNGLLVRDPNARPTLQQVGGGRGGGGGGQGERKEEEAGAGLQRSKERDKVVIGDQGKGKWSSSVASSEENGVQSNQLVWERHILSSFQAMQISCPLRLHRREKAMRRPLCQ